MLGVSAAPDLTAPVDEACPHCGDAEHVMRVDLGWADTQSDRVCTSCNRAWQAVNLYGGPQVVHWQELTEARQVG